MAEEQDSRFDLVALGGGPAGCAGALAAAAFGRTAVVVEREAALGGAGINTGTIPSKTLRESALLLSGSRSRKLLGVDVSVRQGATLRDFVYHERRVTSAEREGLASRCRALGVATVIGRARFLDPHTIAVLRSDGSETSLRGEKILVATGSAPLRPSIFPFGHPRVHDSNEILEIGELPEVLAVIGAGVIGAEYACTFAALGVEVHVVDGRDALLPFLDPEVSAAILRGMTAAGVRFHWKERVERCDAGPAQEIRLALSSGDALRVTDVLVAAGRTSNTEELDLPAAGITAGERGLVPVDRWYRTAVPHIYAAGDVIGAPALAATGMEQARIAVCHAFDLLEKETAPILPTGIYTIPEAAMVGETEPALGKQGIDTVVGRAHYARNPRGRIIGDETGFLKLLFRRGDMRLLGAHAVGEQATELIHVGLVAMLCEAGAELFNQACFNYPTLGDLYKAATYDAILRAKGAS